jgi:hypothetical protein
MAKKLLKEIETSPFSKIDLIKVINRMYSQAQKREKRLLRFERKNKK